MQSLWVQPPDIDPTKFPPPQLPPPGRLLPDDSPVPPEEILPHFEQVKAYNQDTKPVSTRVPLFKIYKTSFFQILLMHFLRINKKLTSGSFLRKCLQLDL